MGEEECRKTQMEDGVRLSSQDSEVRVRVQWRNRGVKEEEERKGRKLDEQTRVLVQSCEESVSEGAEEIRGDNDLAASLELLEKKT